MAKNRYVPVWDAALECEPPSCSEWWLWRDTGELPLVSPSPILDVGDRVGVHGCTPLPRVSVTPNGVGRSRVPCVYRDLSIFRRCEPTWTERITIGPTREPPARS